MCRCHQLWWGEGGGGGEYGPRADQFHFCVFTEMKLGDNPCCFDSSMVFRANCVSVCTVCKHQTNILNLAQPHYSPDLASCDFSLFPPTKRKVAAHQFSCIQNFTEMVDLEPLALFPFSCQVTFESSYRQLKLCVRSGREYFEGM